MSSGNDFSYRKTLATRLSNWDEERLRAAFYLTLVKLGLAPDIATLHKWKKYRR